MASHSSVLAWRIPGMAEPGGLLSMGSHSRTRLKRHSSSSSSMKYISGHQIFSDIIHSLNTFIIYAYNIAGTWYISVNLIFTII